MIRPFLLGAALVLAGCSSGEVTLDVQLTPQVGSAASSLRAASGPSTTPPVSTDNLIELPSAPTLTRIRLLLNEAELTSGDSGGRCPNMGPSVHVENPTVIDLSADEIKNGTSRSISLGQAAAGTYNAGELEIKPLDADDPDTAPALADFKADGASLIVNGTYNGTDFEFRGHFQADQTSKGPIEVGAKASSAMTLTVDTSAWFKDAQGAPLDPANAALHDQIANGICTTLDLEAKDAPEHTSGMSRFGHHGGKGDFAPRARCVEGATAR